MTPLVQAKAHAASHPPSVAISQPSDPAEQEADRIASALVGRTPDASATATQPVAHKGGAVARKPDETAAEAEEEQTAAEKDRATEPDEEELAASEADDAELPEEPQPEGSDAEADEEGEPSMMLAPEEEAQAQEQDAQASENAVSSEEEAQEEEEAEETQVVARAATAPLAPPHAANDNGEYDLQRALDSKGGQALPEETRAFYEEGMGADLSGVRIHTGKQSASAADAIGARAFTRGADVHFASGQYNANPAGDPLLAHELVHTVQQGGAKQARSSSAPTISQQPGTKVNRFFKKLFKKVKRAFKKAGRAIKRGVKRAGRAIRRGFKKVGRFLRKAAPYAMAAAGIVSGGILGAWLGMLHGGYYGALAGGLLGATVGATGGLLLGDKLFTPKRRLRNEEKAYAKEIFKDSVNYDKVRITRDGPLSVGAPRTVGNTIHIPSSWTGNNMFKKGKKGTIPSLSDPGLKLLIHEMTHVWQYQQGGAAYIGDSSWSQFKASFSSDRRGGAYKWRRPQKAGKPWHKWNPEEQAAAVAEYNGLYREQMSLRSKGSDLSSTDLDTMDTLKEYVDNVRAGKGAPQVSAAGAVVGGVVGAGVGFGIGGPTGAVVGGGIGAFLGGG
ncbi:DUF4157 domain-containing protein [Haliangium sp.]|uniref:eCIS core domain-containing protein n=1 Tax=Haliangium sp. TaxID=2663208 RepID=UPI003D0BA4E7